MQSCSATHSFFFRPICRTQPRVSRRRGIPVCSRVVTIYVPACGGPHQADLGVILLSSFLHHCTRPLDLVASVCVFGGPVWHPSTHGTHLHAAQTNVPCLPYTTPMARPDGARIVGLIPIVFPLLPFPCLTGADETAAAATTSTSTPTLYTYGIAHTLRHIVCPPPRARGATWPLHTTPGRSSASLNT